MQRLSISKIGQAIRSQRKFLEGEYKVKRIGIFGSYAEGRAGKESDIDFLVEFREVPDIFKFMKLEYFLEGLLGRKIDLVTRNALKPMIRNRILRETVYL